MFWGTHRDHPDKSWVFLNDGSRLVADLLRIEAEAVVVAGRLWPETRLPRSLVRAILLQPPLNAIDRDRLVFRVLAGDRDEDLLLLDHGDELRGTAPDVVKPEPGEFHPENIAWIIQGSVDPVELPLRNVTAILFAVDRPVPPPARHTQWVGLSDGSRLLSTSVARARNSLVFELPVGMTLETDATGISEANPFEAVVFLQPRGGGLKYLSDLKPLGYKHIPFLSTTWPYKEDRNVSGGRLRSDDAVWLKGLGMHSSSRLAYEVPEPYAQLHGELSIDRRAGPRGSVVFRVYAENGEGEWRKVFESDIVRGGQSPVPMRVDLENAVRIALIVDFADRADQWDHANWLNLRLVAPESETGQEPTESSEPR
ncbi:MAG: NPCBM/NEW2 domain-containing protein [Pirellulaceae bacterium]